MESIHWSLCSGSSALRYQTLSLTLMSKRHSSNSWGCKTERGGRSCGGANSGQETQSQFNWSGQPKYSQWNMMTWLNNNVVVKEKNKIQLRDLIIIRLYLTPADLQWHIVDTHGLHQSQKNLCHTINRNLDWKLMSHASCLQTSPETITEGLYCFCQCNFDRSQVGQKAYLYLFIYF